MLIIKHLPRQVAEMARSDVGRRLSLQEGVVAAIGLVLGDDGEDQQQPDHPDNEPADPSRKKEDCSLETAVQVGPMIVSGCTSSLSNTSISFLPNLHLFKRTNRVY